LQKRGRGALQGREKKKGRKKTGPLNGPEELRRKGRKATLP